MIRRVFSAAIIVAIAAALLVLAWPQLFGLDHAPVIAQVVSLRGMAVALAGVGVVALLLVALLSRAMRRFVASVAVLLLAFAALNLIVLADRGVGDIAFETAGPNDLTVLTWNTLGDAPGAQTVADLALEQGADVITMAETTVEFGTAVKTIMDAAGSPMQVISSHFDLISKARSTTMLVSTALGEYVQDAAAGSTGQLPSIVAKPVSGTGPTLIAVHPVAPIPGELATWNSDLDWLASACVGDNVIMAGDFNSTLDHYSRLPHGSGKTIGDCTDAGKLSGNAAVGTWPASLPPLLGTPIDHVMLTDNWRVSGMRVVQSLDGAGSDHRPVLAQLSPAAGE
jgi:endonuclease/exonuclease/phosphatase (EEP) superfamily protein YafD